LALQQAHLVLQEEDLEILVAVGVSRASEQVDEERDQMHEHEPEQRAPSVRLVVHQRPGRPHLAQA
jgi:hypothetical protein